MDDPQLADQLSSSLLYLATRKVCYEGEKNMFKNRANGETFEIDNSKFGSNTARRQKTDNGKISTSNATIFNTGGSEKDFDSSRKNRSERQEQKLVVKGQRNGTKMNSTGEKKFNSRNNCDFMVPTGDLLKRLSAESSLMAPRNVATIFNSRDFNTKEEQDRTRNSMTLIRSNANPAFESRLRNPVIQSSHYQRTVGEMALRNTAISKRRKPPKDRFRRPPVASVNLKSDTNGEGDRDHVGNRDHGFIYSSSGSGTEGGYAGSASSNDGTSQKDGSAGSSSSETHDFSSGASDGSGSGSADGYTFNTRHSDSSFLLSSSSNIDRENSSDDQHDSFVSSRSSKSLATLESRIGLSSASHVSNNGQCAEPRRRNLCSNVYNSYRKSYAKKRREEKSPILMASCDVMAHVLTFLEPPQILNFITMPISRDWRDVFCHNQELWRILCYLEPFKAQVDSDSSGGNTESSISYFCQSKASSITRFGKYRMLYTSFVRCVRYLARIKDDCMNGRPPSVNDNSKRITLQQDLGQSHSLRNFLSSTRSLIGRASDHDSSAEESPDNSDLEERNHPEKKRKKMSVAIAVEDMRRNSKTTSFQRSSKRKQIRDINSNKKVTLGRSMITERLLGPALGGEVNTTNLELPWSCAIYSIVNWMVAFSDVEGIQISCLKVLPLLLENEQLRVTAHRAGLTDVVLRGMMLFPDSVQLHTVSFHAIVLLARPLGGSEGTLFNRSMFNSSGIFSGRHGTPTGMFTGGPQNGNSKNGIAVMLDSMRRFIDEELLQAMSCWSLVNVALAPLQKEVLVKLGGIEVIANTMMRHPHSAEVQFRALFALINLVIPSAGTTVDPVSDTTTEQQQEQSTGLNTSSEEDVWNEIVGQVVDLVVLAMKNFSSSKAIMNRACLVLNNLSLAPAYHSSLLWSPNCYQMLEWCLVNYRTDTVLQQSAAGTIHRLQGTLSNDIKLRARFNAFQTQQRHYLLAKNTDTIKYD